MQSPGLHFPDLLRQGPRCRKRTFQRLQSVACWQDSSGDDNPRRCHHARDTNHTLSYWEINGIYTPALQLGTVHTATFTHMLPACPPPCARLCSMPGTEEATGQPAKLGVTPGNMRPSVPKSLCFPGSPLTSRAALKADTRHGNHKGFAQH